MHERKQQTFVEQASSCSSVAPVIKFVVQLDNVWRSRAPHWENDFNRIVSISLDSNLILVNT